MYYLNLLNDINIQEAHEKLIWTNKYIAKEWLNKGYLGNNDIILDYNWNSDELVLEKAQYLTKVKQFIIPLLANELNIYNNVYYDVQLWNGMLYGWLNLFLSSFYDKYLTIKKVDSLKIPYTCKIYAVEKPLTIIDSRDFNEMLEKNEEYNIFLYSQIINVLDLKYFQCTDSEVFFRPTDVTDVSIGKSYIKTIVYRNAIYFLQKYCNVHEDILIQDSPFPLQFITTIMIKKKFRVINHANNYTRLDRRNMPKVVDDVWRSIPLKCDGIDEVDEFTKSMLYLTKKCIPISYVEGFKYLYDKMKKWYKYSMNPKCVITSAMGYLWDEEFKIFLMEIKKRHIPVCGMQHGGNYGIEKNWHISEEYNNSDYFYTWGWDISKSYTCKFIGMPASKLLGVTKAKLKDSGKILFINNQYSKFIYRLELDITHYPKSREKEIEFLKNLYQKTEEKVVVRLSPRRGGDTWNVTDKLKSEIPNIVFDETPEFYDSVKESKLCIVFDCQTTFIEALAIGVPVIAVYEKLAATEDEAQKDIRKMIEKGILVDSWDKLFTQVTIVLEDIESWWYEAERQEVVENFVKKYTNYRVDGKAVWEKELDRWLEL